ncbi:TF-B3 domain-containing protein [Forsythia ovata]|uniref:TF-B3 domain-containing protein n=1 Tax=Forsythia ovata TaxID=205694 RepID=A0ABD1W235_9LAMI
MKIDTVKEPRKESIFRTRVSSGRSIHGFEDRFLDEDFFCVPHQLGGVLAFIAISHFLISLQSQYNPYLENGYIPQGIPDHQAVFNRNLFQIFDTNGEKLVRLGSSATKKARKRRMTRQRLIYLHDYPHHSHHN